LICVGHAANDFKYYLLPDFRKLPLIADSLFVTWTFDPSFDIRAISEVMFAMQGGKPVIEPMSHQ